MTFRHFSRPLATAAVLVLAACQDAASPTSPAAREPAEAPLAARSAQAQARLEQLFQRTSPEVMALPGTVFADHDEVAGKLVFGVEHRAAAQGVRQALARLGIAEADYAIELTAPIRFMQTLPATLRSTARPTLAGVQIHFGQYVCTMGFNVRLNGRDAFVTNSHCTNTQGGTEGTEYWQPSRTAEPTAIAVEGLDPEFKRGGASCPRGKRCRSSDASLAYYNAGVPNSLGAIAKTTGVNTTTLNVGGAFAITSELAQAADSVKAGETVNKVGRTTGWSQGRVTRTCVNTSVQGSTVYLYCQNFVSAAVDGGDSGSPVFQITSGDNVRLVGILWGGSGTTTFVYSPLTAVRSELGSFAVR